MTSRDLCLGSINSVMCEHVFSLGCQRVTRGYEMEGKLDELLASFKELKETQNANRKELSEKLEKLEKDLHAGQETAAECVVKKLKRDRGMEFKKKGHERQSFLMMK